MKRFYTPAMLRRHIRSYATLTAEAQMRRIYDAARPLAGHAVIHVNTSAASGGVAEMLKSQVPLERSLGLDSRWVVMRGPELYFEITKKIHHSLQGKRDLLSADEKGAYLLHNHESAQEFVRYLSHFDRAIIVLHDPQVLPLINYVPDHMPVVVRLHPDLSTPERETLDFLKPLIIRATRLIVSDVKFSPRWFPSEKTIVSFPALDPLSQKNREIPHKRIQSILRLSGIDLARPFIAQISRIDPWKDPLGVIAAYRRAKRSNPELQLAIVGINLRGKRSRAEAALYRAVARAAASDPDIHLFGEKEPPAGISNDEFVNAIQRSATIVVQKSIREGFGLSLTEAMWKGAAVIGGDARGIRHQIRNGSNGYIVRSVATCAARIGELLEKTEMRARLGNSAHARVRREFLITRLVLDYLHAYQSVSETRVSALLHTALAKSS